MAKDWDRFPRVMATGHGLRVGGRKVVDLR